MTTVEVYTRDYCGYCVRAKRTLTEQGLEFVEHNASRDPTLREEMIRRSGRRTFPQVFVGETHIGGSDDLEAAARSGRLQKALEQS